MKKKVIIWAAVLAALFIAAVVIGILAFLKNDEIMDVAQEAATPMVSDVRLAGATDVPVPTPMQPSVSPAPEASHVPPTLSPKNEGEGFFTLDILNDTISVAHGVEESTLKKSPGWLTTSARPGEDGMCVVYGHRNRNHLKVLEKVERGDTITVTMNGAAYTYTVSDITIYESTDDLRLPLVDGRTLVLVTCYPFRYSGHAPGKCAVTAVVP